MSADVVDVVVIGDGPGGLAIARSCADLGLDVVVVGPDETWPATYGSWDDASLGIAHQALVSVAPVVAVGTRVHHLAPRYGVFDNGRLRQLLDRDVRRCVDRSTGVQHFEWGSRVRTAGGDSIDARLVFDASGWRPSPMEGPTARQTAYGLVLDERPLCIAGDGVVLMDWRPPTGFDGSTFLYVLGLPEGRWLVEETSLASRVPPGADELQARLAARLGTDLTATSEHVEHVSIPMAPGVPASGPVVKFGAAAGLIHPATGYSVAASLQAAHRVAAAAAASLATDQPANRRSALVWQSVWPTELRRVRALHDYGLQALLRLGDDVGLFFDAFFELPTDDWRAYMRVDCRVSDVTTAMWSIFRSVPWATRAKLAAGNPLAFGRLIR